MSLLSGVFFFIALAMCAAFAYMYRRLQDHQSLRAAVQKMAKLEHAHLDPQVDRRLDANFNRNLNQVLSQFKIAEQRGLDWEKAVDSITDSICIVDESAKIIRANIIFSQRIGVPIQDLIGQNVSKYICDHKDKSCPINHAAKSNTTYEQTVQKSRLGRQLLLTVTPVSSLARQRRFVIVAKETKALETELDGLREILTAQPIPAFIACPNSRKILEVNSKFIEAFAISSPGIYVEDLLYEDRTIDRMKLEQNISMGGRVDLSFAVANGKRQSFELSSVMKRNQNGTPSVSLGMLLPATEAHVQKEEELNNLFNPDPHLAKFATIPVGDIS